MESGGDGGSDGVVVSSCSDSVKSSDSGKIITSDGNVLSPCGEAGVLGQPTETSTKHSKHTGETSTDEGQRTSSDTDEEEMKGRSDLGDVWEMNDKEIEALLWITLTKPQM